MENLAGFKKVLYDCCLNSCMCYSGTHKVLNQCLYCREPHCNEDGKAHQNFKYTPFIPHPQAAQANKTHAHLMYYHAHKHNHTPGKMSDVFDSSHYCDLLQTKVTADGSKLPFYCFFGSMGYCPWPFNQ